MNTPEYRKGYMANLQMQIDINNKYLVANKGNPALQQYIKDSGQQVLGILPSFTPMNVEAKGTKIKSCKQVLGNSSFTPMNVEAKGTKIKGCKQVLGKSLLTPMNVEAKGTKFKGFK